MWLALADGMRTRDGAEQVLLDLQAIAHFAAELRRRLAVDGVDGLDGTLALYRRLKETLDGIGATDLERMGRDIEMLERWLGAAARFLEQLARVKREMPD